jgi:membrane-associated phospholipid phosphatase
MSRQANHMDVSQPEFNEYQPEINSFLDRPKWQIFGLLAIVGWLFVLPFDTSLGDLLNADRTNGDLNKSLALTEFFGHGVGILIVLAIVYQFAERKRAYLPRIVAGLLATTLVVHMIKLTIVRLRPGVYIRSTDVFDGTWVSFFSWFDSSQGFTPNLSSVSQSFPSGHAASAVALAIGLYWLLGRGGWFLGILAALACLQRIEFRAHWPSDVVVGAGIGTIVMGWVTSSAWVAKHFQKWERPDAEIADYQSDLESEEKGHHDGDGENPKPKIAA